MYLRFNHNLRKTSKIIIFWVIFGPFWGIWNNEYYYFSPNLFMPKSLPNSLWYKVCGKPIGKHDEAIQFLLIECVWRSFRCFFFYWWWIWQRQICFLFSAFPCSIFYHVGRTKKEKMKNYFTNTKNLTEAKGREREREKKITSMVPYWFEPFTIYHSTYRLSSKKKPPSKHCKEYNYRRPSLFTYLLFAVSTLRGPENRGKPQITREKLQV